MIKQRELWVDFAKGLSIILVVMGHSGDSTIDHYLGWIRMPLFFIVSGYLFKAVAKDSYIPWSLKRAKQLMIPYVAYGIATALLLFAANGRDVQEFLGNMGKLVYGGQELSGAFAVYWFITCLLITQVAFAFLARFSIAKQAVTLGVLYVLGHVIAWSDYSVPWNADSALLTICYFAVGYHMKGKLTEYIKSYAVVGIAAALAIAFVVLDMLSVIQFTLDVKCNVYSMIGLDLIIPFSVVMVILSACYMITKVLPSKFNPIVKLGTMTVTIMYMHVPVNLVVGKVLGEYGALIYTAVGVIIPVIAYFIIKKIPIMSTIFIGGDNKAKQTA